MIMRPRSIRFLLVLFVAVAVTRSEWLPAQSIPSRSPVNAGETIADELLSTELGKQDRPEARRLLGRVMNLGISKFGPLKPGEPEVDQARRFFKAMDDALIQANFIFPPRELIDLLSNALVPRTLSTNDYERAISLVDNRRRQAQMKKTFERGEHFHFADCDLTAIIYVAIGQRLGLPIVMVGVPQHDFVRWSSPTLKLNWDTNEGKTYTDAEYAKKWGVTQVGREKLGWLGDMSRVRVIGYWHQMIGSWHERQGRHPEALAAFRRAVAVCPDDLEAANTLAWFLATGVDAKLRNGAEAVKIAARVVEAAPRANWIDTLAAAQAEVGDFKTAIATELRAKEAAKTKEWGVSEGELLAGFDKCIAAYRKGLTYRKAAEAGEIDDPKLKRPYD